MAEPMTIGLEMASFPLTRGSGQAEEELPTRTNEIAMGDSARSDLVCRVEDCAHICAQLIHANRSLPALNRHVSHQLKIELGFGPWVLPQQPVTSKTAQTLLLSHSGNQQVALAPSIKGTQGRQRSALTSLCNWRASGSFG